MLAAASLISLAAYTWILEGAYASLRVAYRDTNVLREIASTDSRLMLQVCRGKDYCDGSAGGVKRDTAILQRLLQLLGFDSEDKPVRVDDDKSPFYSLATSVIPAIHGGVASDGDVQVPDDDDETCHSLLHESRATLEVIVKIVAEGAKSTPTENATTYEDDGREILSAMLASWDGVEDRYSEILKPSYKASSAETLAYEEQKQEDTHLRFRDFFRSQLADGINQYNTGLRFSPPATANDADALRLLYMDYGHLDEGDSAATAAVSAPSGFEARDALVRELVSRLHASDAVKDARKGIAFAQGWVQYAIATCGTWMLLLMGVRGMLRRYRRWEIDQLGPMIQKRVDDVRQGRAKSAKTRGQKLKVIIEDAREEMDRARRRILPDAREPLGDERPERAGRSAFKGPWMRIVNTHRWLVARFVASGSPAEDLLWACQRELEVNKESYSTSILEDECELLRRADRRSRWQIMWCSTALPALGFIGTVLGISSALSMADSIVRAQTAAGQAAAITDVSETLGIAFTTTLLALVLGLLTSVLNTWQSAKEDALVDDVERALTPVLDIARGGGAAGGGEGSADGVPAVHGAAADAPS